MKANIVITALVCLLSLAMGYFGIFWGLKWKNRAEQLESSGSGPGIGKGNDMAGLKAKINLLQKQLELNRAENDRLNLHIEELQGRGAEQAGAVPAFDGPVLENLRAGIESIRGIRFVEDLVYHLVPREEVAAAAASQILPRWTEKDLQGRRLAYAAMGFIDPETELGNLTAQLKTGNINAYYDKEEPAILIASDLDARDFNHRLAVASAQVEAMIHQNFKIGTLRKAANDSEEAELAMDSLVQGDMSLVLALLAQKETEEGNIEHASNAMANQRDESLSTAPLFLRDLLMFPVIAGGAFCRKLYSNERGSFKAINAAYARPPRDTSEILHEGKYLKRLTMPPAVRMSPSYPNGKSGMAVDDREPVWSETAGELRIRMLFKPTLSPKQASEAGLGWAADRYFVYEMEAGSEDSASPGPGEHSPSALPDASVVWISSWDTEGDAGEFFAALIDHWKKRYDLGEEDPDPAGKAANLQAGGRRILLRRADEGNAVLLIDSANAEWLVAFQKSGLIERLGFDRND